MKAIDKLHDYIVAQFDEKQRLYLAAKLMAVYSADTASEEKKAVRQNTPQSQKSKNHNSLLSEKLHPKPLNHTKPVQHQPDKHVNLMDCPDNERPSVFQKEVIKASAHKALNSSLDDSTLHDFFSSFPDIDEPESLNESDLTDLETPHLDSFKCGKGKRIEYVNIVTNLRQIKPKSIQKVQSAVKNLAKPYGGISEVVVDQVVAQLIKDDVMELMPNNSVSWK